MGFGIVGIIAFVIDFGLLNLFVGVFHMHNVLASTLSFLISLVFNYLASMKYVFKHRDDMARWMEIVIFFPAKGRSFSKRSRMATSAGIKSRTHSIFILPYSASDISLTWLISVFLRAFLKTS